MTNKDIDNVAYVQHFSRDSFIFLFVCFKGFYRQSHKMSNMNQEKKLNKSGFLLNY